MEGLPVILKWPEGATIKNSRLMVKTVPEILAQIVEWKKLELSRRDDGVEQLAEASITDRRDFLKALTTLEPAVIAEIKKTSPSKGVLAEEFDPAAIARAYDQGGAAALSVLTDEKHFHPRLSHLASARPSPSIPP